MVKVALCWDDGVYNDIRVTELLKRYHAKATFNLNPGKIHDQSELPSWHHDRDYCQGFMGYQPGRVGKADLVNVYGDFQVATHCWNHEDAAVTDTAEFVKSAVDTRKFLEDIFQRPCPGFAWPYGRGTQAAADGLRENGFIYGRLTGRTENIFNAKDPLLLTPSCHFQAHEFWKIFDESKKNCGLFYFWGHSYEMMSCEDLWKQFEYKLEFLDADPEVEWIDVADIAKLFPKA